jgi:hypothetical protein
VSLPLGDTWCLVTKARLVLQHQSANQEASLVVKTVVTVVGGLNCGNSANKELLPHSEGPHQKDSHTQVLGWAHPQVSAATGGTMAHGLQGCIEQSTEHTQHAVKHPVPACEQRYFCRSGQTDVRQFHTLIERSKAGVVLCCTMPHSAVCNTA